MTYPQQPYGGQNPYAGYGGYGPPPPPPQRKNTAAIVSVVAVGVVLLAAVGITGFVAPGFFLSDDEPTGAGGTTSAQTTTSSPEPDTGGGEEVLSAVVDGLDSQDADALKDVTCADAEQLVDEAIANVDAVTKAELVDIEEVSDEEVKGTVEVTADDETGEVEVTAVRSGDEWCWQDIKVNKGGSRPTASSEPAEPTSGPGGGEPTAGGKPVPPGALTAMQTFLDAINSGDAAAAKGTLCADAIATPANVDELVGYDPDLRIDPKMDGIASGSQSVQLYLRGTAKGQELEGYSTNLWVTNYDGSWCVHAFRAVVI